MLHNDYARWEQGVNRVAQVDIDDGGEKGPGSKCPVEIVVRVSCLFDRTEETQLALMLPRERVQGNYSSAHADPPDAHGPMKS